MREGLGQAAYSPDGTLYANVNVSNPSFAYVNLYDFDRCTGELSNHRQYLNTEGTGAVGVSFSPNSRYLYFNTRNNIYQYDTYAEDVWASEEHVAEYDGYEEEIYNPVSGSTFYVPTSFFLQQLGPDGKIYLNATNSVSSLHVIDQPNEAGAACNVIQRGLDLPALNRVSLPNFPNYRLRQLEGSPCDTLDIMSSTAEVPRAAGAVRVYPNPSEGYFTVEVSDVMQRGAEFILYNGTGQVVKTQRCIGISTQVYAPELPAGVYFYRLSSSEGLIEEGKIVINK